MSGREPIDNLIFYFDTSVGGEIGFIYSFASKVSADL